MAIFNAQLDVRTLHLVIDGLADVMEQTRALGELHIRAQLRRHQTGQMADLDAVLEHVLAVARAIAHAAKQLDQLVVDAVHVRFEDGLLAGLANLIVHLALGLFDHFQCAPDGCARRRSAFPARFAQPRGESGQTRRRSRPPAYRR